MKLEIKLLNSLWLIVPLLVWNIILGPKITSEAIISDANSPRWLLMAENITRMAVFALPLFIPLDCRSSQGKLGLAIFIIGILIYFGSWLPHLTAPDSSWSTSAVGLLAPRLTPLIPFIGVAVIGNSWTYAGFSLVFVLLHTWHGIQNL